MTGRMPWPMLPQPMMMTRPAKSIRLEGDVEDIRLVLATAVTPRLGSTAQLLAPERLRCSVEAKDVGCNSVAWVILFRVMHRAGCMLRRAVQCVEPQWRVPRRIDHIVPHTRRDHDCHAIGEAMLLVIQ